MTLLFFIWKNFNKSYSLDSDQVGVSHVLLKGEIFAKMKFFTYKGTDNVLNTSTSIILKFQEICQQSSRLTVGFHSFFFF